MINCGICKWVWKSECKFCLWKRYIMPIKNVKNIADIYTTWIVKSSQSLSTFYKNKILLSDFQVFLNIILSDISYINSKKILWQLENKKKGWIKLKINLNKIINNL